MSSLIPSDLDASRPRSGILTPSSEASLNNYDGGFSVDSESRRRKRADSVAMDHLLKPSIAVKPHPHNLTVQPRVLQPLMLLPRRHLSLASIDLGDPTGGFPQSRFYESHIKILDLESRMGSAQSVLIARSEPKGALYALERQANGLYVVCRLGAWVQIDQLASNATAVCRERLRPSNSEATSPQPTSAGLTTPQTYKEHKRKLSAIEAIQSLVRKRPRSQSISTSEDATRPRTATGSEGDTQLPTPNSIPDSDVSRNVGQHSQCTTQLIEPEQTTGPAPQQTAEIIFDNIKTHYFEALYKSMGSLAYFAKGPMSRARSAFRLDLEANLNMCDLIDFLKGLLLTTVQIDKKYRETVPELISKLKDTLDSSDECAKRKRRPKKFRLGKDGLYPTEHEKVHEWWTANKPELQDDDANIPLPQIKSHVSLLRTRETQLQMILILEILALEPLKTSDDTVESNLPTLPGAVEAGGQMAPPPIKKRNKHNLPVLMDVHADRLTIWQSTASDEQLLLEDSQVTHQPGEGGAGKRASTEPLRDFCVDVIVPFFSARLPELCDSVNRKLGGPVILSPPNSKAVKGPPSKKDQKPGAAAKRPAPPSVPRTLQRALSTEMSNRRSVSRGPSNMIALMRSASSTSVAGIKREGSEPAALRMFAKTELNMLGQRQGSLSRTHSLGSLEDAKATKKAQVDAELKDAISALRKPNRDVVGKALAEAAQQRAVATQTKRIKKPVRSSLASAIQVKATPTNNRFKDMLGMKSLTPADVPLPSTEETIPPSSVGTLVPSTLPRKRQSDADMVGSTPIRASASSNFLRRPLNEEPAIPPSSPLMSRGDSVIHGSAVKPLRKLAFPAARPQRLFETPVKKSAPRPTEDIGNSPLREPQKGASIYEKLGWDDDLDDL